MMKKILAFVMAATMILGMGVTSSAAQNPDGKIGTSDDTGDIVILNAEKGITVNLYKIVRAKYSEAAGVFEGFETTDDAYKDILKDDKEDVDYSALAGIGADTINQLAAVKKDVEKSTFTGDSYFTETTPEDTAAGKKAIGKYILPDLGVGMYLVELLGSETTIYNYAVASIYYAPVEETGKDPEGNETTSTTGNILVDGNTDGKALDIKSAAVYAKSIDHPQLVKKAAGADGHSVNIGERIEYKVEIAPVPFYNGEYPVLNIVDTLSTGLTLDAASVSIKGYKKDSAEAVDLLGTGSAIKDDISVTSTQNTLTVDFVKTAGDKRAYLLNDYAGGKVEITYQATLNDHAVINRNSNDNEAELSYTTDSKVDKTDGNGNPGDKRKEDKTYTYTFDLDGDINEASTQTNVNKALFVKTDGTLEWSSTDVDTRTVVNPLEGAQFGLYTDEECSVPYTRAADAANGVAAFGGKAVSNAGGLLEIKGLKAGTEDAPAVYYLKEDKAPEGYSLNTKIFKIRLWAEYYAAAENGFDAGQLKKWYINIDDQETSVFTVEHQGSDIITASETVTTTGISNTKLSSLPSTGGIGTTIFTIGGCVIMIAAAGLFFASRRKYGSR